ncbi:heavy metal translocating P-type ATPase [Acholeplasma laidlawii]|uniref:heavy metal translocating P-type ATPase n=1 Tax=Acholeplasma laidlawii TaxID=2148 RepID=UPI0018C2B7A5|nr:heavy metal translocating P-type ATPase [Acholeplasma laidlawii]MBG0762032.1 heavy metal translocating P-type ATPase [Acholeplasma laidlawii]
MVSFIYKQKIKIMILSILLIVSGFISRYAFDQKLIFDVTLMAASIIGVLPIAISAFQALKVKVISIDLLVTIAVLGAFIIKAYEESAIVTFLFLFGAYLEQRTLNKTRSAIKALTEMAPETALKKMDDGEFLEVGIDDVEVTDILLVKTGAKVPVDGIVLSGSAYINEASITGEAVSVKKVVDSKVFAGTILDNGTIQIVAQKVGEDTTFGKIIELVEEAQDSKSEAEKFIDRFATWYTPFVLVLALIVWVITQDVALAITILVLGCPGALVIGVPVSNVAGIGNGARHGVLLKGSEVIGNFSKVDTIVFDKTGTLTIGHPVLRYEAYFELDKIEIIPYIYSIEKQSDHPLAKAITGHIKDAKTLHIDHTDVIKGGGIVASIHKKRVLVGNLVLMKDNGIEIKSDIMDEINRLEHEGHSIVLAAIDEKLVSLMGIRDEVRPNLVKDLKRIKKMGVKNLIVLSGDNQGSVDIVAKELGLSKAVGNMLPEDKANYIKKLMSEGHMIAFVGDGVNDSPSIALAHIGIAMGGGTDVAIETSDVVLMNDNINKLPHALGLAKATKHNMIQNILIAIGVVVVLLVSLFWGEWVNMSIGMLVHEASILVVILNAMRLLRYKTKNN